MTDLRHDSALPPIRALLLDLDETLLDGTRFYQSLIHTCRALARRRPELGAQRLLDANAAVWRELGPRYMEDWTLGRMSGANLQLEVWRRSLQACRCDDEAIVRLAGEVHARQARNTYRAFADVAPLLEAAAGNGVSLGLVTNGASDTQRDKLLALGIADHFQAVIVSGDLAVAKPDRAIFAAALEALDMDGEGVWHVGDSLELDVAGARSAGLTAVWLNRTAVRRAVSDPLPHLEIRSLAQLRARLLPADQ